MSAPVEHLHRWLTDRGLGCAACGNADTAGGCACIYLRASDGHRIGYLLCDRCSDAVERSEAERLQVLGAVEMELGQPADADGCFRMSGRAS